MEFKCKKCDFVDKEPSVKVMASDHYYFDNRRLKGHDYQIFEVSWECSKCGEVKNIKVK